MMEVKPLISQLCMTLFPLVSQKVKRQKTQIQGVYALLGTKNNWKWKVVMTEVNLLIQVCMNLFPLLCHRRQKGRKQETVHEMITKGRKKKEKRE